MGLLEGRNALVFGVANDHSIAWGIAQALHAEGARSASRRSRASSTSASGRWPSRSGRPSSSRATSSRDADIERVFDALGRDATTASTSSSTPSPSRSARTCRARSSTRRATGSRSRMDVSAYSLVALAARRPAAPPRRLVDHDPDLLRRPRRSSPTTTSWASPRRPSRRRSATSPRTSVPTGIRVNAISAGPDPDAGRRRHRRLQADVRRVRRGRAAARATSRSRTSAKTAVYLASDLSSAVTGEVIYVDGGFNIIGVPTGGDGASAAQPRRSRPCPDGGLEHRPASARRSAVPRHGPVGPMKTQNGKAGRP